MYQTLLIFSKCSKFITLCLMAFTYCHTLNAQEGFQKYQTFFETQQVEYQYWLQATGLNAALRTDSLEVTPSLVRLYLTGVEEASNCKDLQSAWETWKKRFNKAHRRKQLFHEKLLETWSILTEIPTDSLEIILHCHGLDEGQFHVRIHGESNGAIRFEAQNPTAMGRGIIDIPFGHLDTIYTGQRLDSIGRLRTVRKVRLAISDYLLNTWYKDKGTPVLYNVRMDTLESYYHEFTFEFTHISGEVLKKGKEYFEYHRIKVEVQNKGGKIEISWQFTGKFGSGILFPPRDNDYKLMETYYKEALEAYETKLFKLITEHLKRQP